MTITTAQQLAAVRFNEHGLIPIVAQHALTGSVLMLAYANREALERTLETRVMHYYSRSRSELWQKGATSGNTQRVIDLHLDCDADAILARVLPAGPACHTGARTCFNGEPTLVELSLVIEQRMKELPEGSYTTRLLRDDNLRLKKLGEEAMELALACQAGSRVAEEAADLLYHVVVAVMASGGSIEDVLGELAKRRG